MKRAVTSALAAMKRAAALALTVVAAAAATALGACAREPAPSGPSADPSVASARAAPTSVGPMSAPADPGRGLRADVAAVNASAPAAEAAPSRPPRFVETPPVGGLRDTIRAEARAADAAGETLVVYVGARWCEPCQHFERALASGKLDGPLSGLRLLHVDLDARGAELGAQGYATKVIPYFVVPTPKGGPSSRTFAAGAAGGAVVDQIVAGLAPFRPGAGR